MIIMTKRLIATAFCIISCATAYFGGGNVFEDCSKTTDEDIAAAIMSKISADKILSDQRSHINISVKNKAVKIQGWVKNTKDYQKVVDYAMEAPCVRVVNVNDFEDKAPEIRKRGCVDGTKPCGDICIPVKDKCNIGDSREEE